MGKDPDPVSRTRNRFDRFCELIGGYYTWPKFGKKEL